MTVTDERIDAYISGAAPFAVPILTKIRSLVHEACPNVAETIKWSFPNFVYKGSILCSMASFSKHCSFGFWLASQMSDPDHILSVTDKGAMGNLGQLQSIADLPKDEVLVRYLKQAMELIDKGVKAAKKPAGPAGKIVEVPDYFTRALATNEKAKHQFEAFPYSHKKEYLQWITEAKTEATREKRIATALEWIAEGKGRNWKYER